MSPASIYSEATEGDAPAALDLLATLVLDIEARQAWLAERDSVETRELFDQALLHIGGLMADSGWETDDLLQELGCNKRRRDELEAMGVLELESCRAFFEWLTSLINDAPDEAAKRAVISGGSLLYSDARRELDECKMAIGRKDFEDLSPSELIELGEVGGAFQLARQFLSSPAGQRARERAQTNAFVALPKVHIRTTTLDALITEPHGLPGASISFERAGRLALHIDHCGPCKAARERREEALGRHRDPTPISFPPLGSYLQ
jgi:hypothetical protein